ncbi:hypothetical protein CRV02_01060 [Arcobacter sp. CECT 8989]|uniref:hypothetical protein n=1 Tax=Arcobacter sp. CECT 8989 TaxID=2044509 RepID=UPI00100ACED8|nr:hypothetical protein [Arcobacter sp. CECT 8989]RXK03815.1 hypothetical protein CRV02_01060 [Arcobacter sp. CECT 8989]
MSKIEFSYSNNGKEIKISGEGGEVKEIAKLTLNPSSAFVGAMSLLSLKNSFDFNEEVEKPMKSRAIIKKINAHTVEVNGYKLSLKDEDIDFEVTPGRDYYVYELYDGQPFISDGKDLTDKKIGGFHYGLAPEDFEPINNIDKTHAKKIAGINAYSIYDEKHRPKCNPEGMVYIPKLDIWADIYLLNSEHKGNGTSFSSGSIAAGYESNGRKKPHGEKNLVGKVINAIANLHNKRLPTKDEFQVFADGVKENDSARDLDDGTIKFLENFTSKYGINQATGVQWTWTSTEYGEDRESDPRYICGGSRYSNSDAGSRSANWSYFGHGSYWLYGCRFVCDPLNPVK